MAKRSATTHLVVHCSATPPNMDIGANEIDRMHRARGFFSIGYHGVIRRNGLTEPGRNWDQIGAHARGFNKKSLSVCLVGGVSLRPLKHVPGNPWNGADAEDNFTDEQWHTLPIYIEEVWSTYGRIPVIGHRDIPGVTKACPSFSVNEKMLEWFPNEYDKVYPKGFPSRWEN